MLEPGDSEAARVTAELNDRLAKDERVDVALLGFADGITHGPQAVSGLPTDDRGWFELVLSNQPPLWQLMAEACGGGVWADGDLQAALVPASPNRSFFNSVFYGDTERLLDAPAAACEAYDEAGVNAWTVWVPATDDAGEGRPGGGRSRPRRHTAGDGLGALRPAGARPGSRARDPRGDGHGAAPRDQRDGLRLSAGRLPADRAHARHRGLPRQPRRRDGRHASCSGTAARTRRSPSSPPCPRRVAAASRAGFSPTRWSERASAASPPRP